MPLLQWLPHSYVGPRQLHRIIIRGTMKCPGHWQLIWLTVQYFHQGNKPRFATEAKVWAGAGSVVGVGLVEGGKWNGWRRTEGRIWENVSPAALFCVFHSHLGVWDRNGRLIECIWACQCTTECMHEGVLVSAFLMMRTDSCSPLSVQVVPPLTYKETQSQVYCAKLLLLLITPSLDQGLPADTRARAAPPEDGNCT